MSFSASLESTRESAHLAVRQALGSSKSKVFVLWDELLLTVVNCPPRLLKELTFITKELVRGKTERTPVECYETERVEGLLVAKTHQGFWKRTVLWLVKHRHEFEFMDLRIKDLIGPPKLNLMKGFRYSQRALLIEALMHNCSGTISAITRFGKTPMAQNILRAWPKEQAVVFLPGKDLLKQAYREYTEAFPDREVKLIGAGSRVKYQSEDITICSMDSAHKLDAGPVRIVLLDEAHAMVAESRIDSVARFAYARKYAFTSTPTGRYDGRDFLLEGMVGPVLVRRTYTEAVAEGAICPCKVMMIRWPVTPVWGDRAEAYRELVRENELFGRCIRYLSDVIIPRHWQTLFFIGTEDQANFLADAIGKDISIAMAKVLTDKDREEMVRRIADNHISRAICSNILVQGMTFHELMCLVNCNGGGSSTSTIQKPGRLLETRPGKSCGLMVDFLFVPPKRKVAVPGADEKIELGGAGALVWESKARLAAYEAIGYDVSIVERSEIEAWFHAQNITAPDEKKN